MIVFYYIKTKQGIWISDSLEKYGNMNAYLSSYLFDGEPPQRTFSDKWLCLSKIPEKVQIKRNKLVSYRWEKVSGEGIPEKPLPEWLDENGNFRSDFFGFLDYYKRHDTREDYLEDVAFRMEFMLEYDMEFSKPVQREYRVAHQRADEIAFPSFLLHTKPARIESKDLYDLVRKHILTHIDTRFARVCSNYDFCFEVEKVIGLSVPYSFTPNSESKKKFPKKVYVNDRKVVVFKMTHANRKYEGYPVIEPIVADSEAELDAKINNLLKDIMEIINEPLADCPHCNGTGVSKKSS